MLWLDAGALYRSQVPDAGGWGDPLTRDPEAVRRDVRDEKISVEFAAQEHGVIIALYPLAIDDAATAERRARLRSETR